MTTYEVTFTPAVPRQMFIRRFTVEAQSAAEAFRLAANRLANELNRDPREYTALAAARRV